MPPADTVAWRTAHTWTTRTAGVLRGISHGFGNRLHALELFQHALEPGEVVPEDLAGAARDELDGFAALVEHNRLLAFAPDEDAQACRVVELLPAAVAMRALHVDVFVPECEVLIEGDPPAIFAPPRALTQALLLLLLESQPGSAEPPSVSVRGVPDGVEVLVLHGAAEDDDDAAAAAVRWMLRGVHPAVTLERAAVGASAAYRLALPSLAAARSAGAGRPRD